VSDLIHRIVSSHIIVEIYKTLEPFGELLKPVDYEGVIYKQGDAVLIHGEIGKVIASHSVSQIFAVRDSKDIDSLIDTAKSNAKRLALKMLRHMPDGCRWVADCKLIGRSDGDYEAQVIFGFI
jgi:hypothetical protein